VGLLAFTFFYITFINIDLIAVF